MVFVTCVAERNEEEDGMIITGRADTPGRYESLIPYFFMRR